MLIASNGAFYFTGFEGERECVGTLSVSNGVVSGSCQSDAYGPPGATHTTEAVSGSISAQSLTIAFTDYVPSGAFVPRALSGASVAGSWMLVDLAGEPGTPDMAIDSNGVINWPGKYGCNTAGQISLIDPDAYSVTLTYGVNCSNEPPVTGLAWVDTSVSPAMLEMAFSNTTSTALDEFVAD